MPFVSHYYEVLGKDALDWMIWPANGIAVAIPLGLVGFGLSFVWQPFIWLMLVAYGIAIVASAYVLVFLAAAGIQVLLNQLAPYQESTDPPKFIRLLMAIPLKLWGAGSCVPAALSLPVICWGVFGFNDAIVLAGIGLFLLPVLTILMLAAIARITSKSATGG